MSFFGKEAHQIFGFFLFYGLDLFQHTNSSSAIRLPRGQQALHAPSYRRTPKNQRTTSKVNGTPSSQRINPFPMLASPFLAG